MKAGDLRHVVTLVQIEVGKDASGGRVEIERGRLQVRANVRFKNGKEATSQGFEIHDLTASVRIRTGIDVDVGHRLEYQNKLYFIDAILPSSDGVFVDLVVKYHTPD